MRTHSVEDAGGAAQTGGSTEKTGWPVRTLTRRSASEAKRGTQRGREQASDGEPAEAAMQSC